MKEIKRKQLSVALVAAIGTSVLATSSAYAQQAQKVERIEVTGSNIKRTDAETAEPIIVISREEIANSGKQTLAEYLQTMTVDGQGSVPTSFGNGFAAGSTAIALRGLGANATLTLLNGRRLAPYPRPDDFQKQLSDLSTIPLEAIERIEILKDGASAIYGSDALAGVVNIILRKDFTGVVAKVEGGTSRYSDGNRVKGALTLGGGDLARDKWNAFINLEAMKSDEIHFRDRSRKWIGRGDVRPYGYDILASQWTPGYQTSATGTPSASPAGYIRDPATRRYQLISPCSSVAAAIVPAIAGDRGCSYDLGQFRDFQPKIDEQNVFARATYAFSPNWELYGEASYGKNKSAFDVSLLTATPSTAGPYGFRSYGTGLGAPEITIGANHPDNPFGAATRFRYAFAEFGAQRRKYDSDIERFLVGIKGNGWGWDIDGGVLHSESNLNLDYTVLNIAALYNAFTTGVGGFYRIGANQGLNSDAQRAALLVHATAKNTTKLDIVDLKGSRELMQLSGGPLALALGTEYRKMNVDAPSLSGTDTGTVGASYVASFGHEKVWAAYGEILAPVLRQVELSAAVRHDKYDNFSSTTPKVSVKYTPVQSLAIRATYAEGFRAPNGPESNARSAAAASSGGVRDPIRCPLVNGVPTPLTALGANASDCTGTAVAGIGAGNPNLKPEKSKNYDLGFIFEPMRDLSFAVDLWKIKKKDEIGTSSFAAAALLPTVIRADNNLTGIPNSGTLLAVQAPFQNANETSVVGFDVDASYRMRLGDYGRMKYDVRWTRINSIKRVNDDGTTEQWAGTHGNCDVTNCIGSPKDKVNLVASWDMGPFGLTGIVNWRSAITNVYTIGDTACGSNFASGADAPGGCKIASFWTFDLSGRWNVLRNLQVYGSIQNLFDRVAPLDPTTYGGINYNPMDVSGAMGRYYTLGLKYTFK